MKGGKIGRRISTVSWMGGSRSSKISSVFISIDTRRWRGGVRGGSVAAEERRHEGAEVVGGGRAWSRRRGKERGTQVCGRKLEYCRYERERVLRAASIRGAYKGLFI